MKVIRPTTMTESMLISSNAVEAHPQWSISTTYAKGARVIYGASIYESLVNSNVGKQPDTSILEWVRVGPDNTWAMFDPQISTQTTTSTNLTVTVATGTIDSVYLGNVVGLSATITVRDGLGGPIIYQQTQSLTGETVGDWYQYFFFDPLLLRNQAIFQGIPPYAGSHLTIEIEGSGTVALGMATFGRVTMIGSTSYGASAGIIDYSRKDTNEFGETTFVQRFPVAQVGAGQQRTIVHYVRSSWSVSDYADPYTVVVDAPKFLATDPDDPQSFEQNPFTVRVYIDNQ
jgi:hypothetical protein